MTNMKFSYQSTDIVIASTLFYHGFIPTAVRDENYRRAIFHFGSEVTLSDLLARYWKGEVSVEPRRYSSCIRELKAMVQACIQTGQRDTESSHINRKCSRINHVRLKI